MVDKERVCCLCGDVGFPHKLFRCSRCRFRFQHSYCSNYYCGEAKEKDNICDWCHYEAGKNPSSSPSSSSPTSIRHGVSFKRSSPSSEPYHHLIRSEYTASGERIKMMHPPYHPHHDNQDSTTNESPKPSKNSGPSPSPSPSPRVPSPRPNGHRRYKLLKDVMC